jgi:hypothetical protein
VRRRDQRMWMKCVSKAMKIRDIDMQIRQG